MYSSTLRFRKKIGLASGVLLSLPAAVLAGGLSLNDQSASTSGVSNAGVVAHVQDASTVFFNPAGMSRLSGTNLSFGMIVFEIEAVGRDSKTIATRANGDRVIGDGGGDHVDTTVVPNVFLTQELNDWVDVGIGFYIPYGLGLEYGDNFAGRFLGQEVKLASYAVSPSIAVSSPDGFALGVGINLLYMDGKQRNPVDFSGVEAHFGLPSGTFQDGYVDLQGDDFAVEFTFGLMWQASDQTSVGISARTGTDFDLKGEARGSRFPTLTPSGFGQQNVTEKVQVPVKVPESISFGIAHQFNETLTLLAGAVWTKWSRAAELGVISRESNPVAFPAEKPAADQLQYWKDTWQWSVGAIWEVSPALALKAGYAFDQSAVDQKTRMPLAPFDDYHLVSLGVQINDLPGKWTADMFLSRVLYDGDIPFDYQASSPAQGRTSFVSKYDITSWMAGLQLSKSF